VSYAKHMSVRMMGVVGCAAALAASAVLVAAPASAKNCPSGTSQTRWEGVCTQSGSNGPAYLPPSASAPGANVVLNPNGFSTVNGIPCTPENYGKCIALQQSQG
jgi:hypothetical protein